MDRHQHTESEIEEDSELETGTESTEDEHAGGADGAAKKKKKVSGGAGGHPGCKSAGGRLWSGGPWDVLLLPTAPMCFTFLQKKKKTKAAGGAAAAPGSSDQAGSSSTADKASAAEKQEADRRWACKQLTCAS